jgi:hypothetical protein
MTAAEHLVTRRCEPQAVIGPALDGVRMNVVSDWLTRTRCSASHPHPAHRCPARRPMIAGQRRVGEYVDEAERDLAALGCHRRTNRSVSA